MTDEEHDDLFNSYLRECGKLSAAAAILGTIDFELLRKYVVNIRMEACAGALDIIVESDADDVLAVCQRLEQLKEMLDTDFMEDTDG